VDRSGRESEPAWARVCCTRCRHWLRRLALQAGSASGQVPKGNEKWDGTVLPTPVPMILSPFEGKVCLSHGAKPVALDPGRGGPGRSELVNGEDFKNLNSRGL
jgi:hypothetical protein